MGVNVCQRVKCCSDHNRYFPLSLSLCSGKPLKIQFAFWNTKFEMFLHVWDCVVKVHPDTQRRMGVGILHGEVCFVGS